MTRCSTVFKAGQTHPTTRICASGKEGPAHFTSLLFNNNMENRTEDVARAAKLAAHDKRW